MSQKKKLTLTIESDLIESAKLVAEHRGASLSSIVEGFLRTISNTNEEEDWLDHFHKKYLPTNYTEPSDEDIQEIVTQRARKHI